MALEEPRYEVLKKQKEFELRRYEPFVVARTVVSGPFGEVGNKAFRILVRYISGENRQNAEIPMTAPVIQRPELGQTNTYWLSFVMPSNMKMPALPAPMDSGITLEQVPARLVAARTYSGTWSHSRYRIHEQALVKAVAASQYKTVGEPIFARYNPPYTPWFLRRNEVLVELEPVAFTTQD